MAELIILGNGFDLAIGLETKFDHFIGSIEAKMKSLFQNMNFTNDHLLHDRLIVREPNENYWALLLFIAKHYEEKIYDWNHVEKLIKQVVLSTCDNWDEREMLKNLLRIGDDVKENTDLNCYSKVLINFRRMRMSMDGMKYIENRNSIIDFLFKELMQFELDFSVYINQIDKQLKSSDQSVKLLIASNLLSKITGQLPIRSNQPHTFGYKVHIVNFNYTDYLSVNIPNFEKGWGLYDTYSPIHGMAKNNNIIIGIDETNLEADQLEYCFTKTSRLLNSPFTESDSYNTFMRSDIDSIKFYGHSLSEFDYSYFQSIFDRYNIYNPNVKLEFLYTDYLPGTNVKGAYTNSVLKLMKDYGESLDNRRHGRNLLHKMIIEGRLKIREIQVERNFI